MPIAAVGIMAGTSLLGGALQSSAAGKAANTQAAAAMRAAELEHDSADKALAFQEKQWQTTQNNMRPFLNAGTGAINTLSSLMSPGGQLTQGWNEQFKAPDATTVMNDPGVQFRLAEGAKALERSAAARGNLLTGATAKNVNAYAQDMASNEYSNAYGRAFNEYTNRYNTFQNNQANLYNRYANMAGMGQTTATNLGTMGNQVANNYSGTLMNYAQNAGQQFNNAGAARASGYMGSANAWGGAIGGIGNNLMNYYMMQQFKPQTLYT